MLGAFTETLQDISIWCFIFVIIIINIVIAMDLHYNKYIDLKDFAPIGCSLKQKLLFRFSYIIPSFYWFKTEKRY